MWNQFRTWNEDNKLEVNFSEKVFTARWIFMLLIVAMNEVQESKKGREARRSEKDAGANYSHR